MFSAPMFYIQDTSLLFSVLNSMLIPFNSFGFFQLLVIKGKLMLVKASLGLVSLFLYSFYNEFKQLDFIEEVTVLTSYKRWGLSLLIVSSIFFLGSFEHEPFIYFEF